jgi:hypothetical protein
MRLLWLCGAAGLVLGGTVSVTAAQQTNAKTTAVKVGSESRPIRLDNISDWNTFIAEFRRAVEHRDKKALRGAMDLNFRYTFERTPGGDPRDEALDLWDHSGGKAWATMDQILGKGNRNDPEVPGLMVCPPAWVDDSRYIGYRAGFMKVGGNWRWIWYVNGDY